MQQRPVFLNLLQIRLPISGVMSILHRISGVLMVFLAAFFVWALGESLNGEEGYRLVVGLFGTVPGKLFLFLGQLDAPGDSDGCAIHLWHRHRPGSKMVQMADQLLWSGRNTLLWESSQIPRIQ